MTKTERARLTDLVRHGVGVIRANQDPTGAYLASPSFPVYRYSWFRDGAFIADAMSRAGDVESAEAFFAWCARILVERRERIESLVARRAAGETIDPAEHLHTRYTATGEESDAPWWNFQLDGYGAWLWALGAHATRHDRPVEPFLDGAVLSARYVASFWDVPSYDWWEEHPDHRHTSTLAALHAGLRAAARWPMTPVAVREAADGAADGIRSTVLADARRLGYLPKWLGREAVDASLLACGHPFGLLAVDDPIMVATIGRIETDLVHGGGVHRYTDDTYYGGGEWLLLAALLGWQYLALGRVDDAHRQLLWVAAHARPDGDLPEQVDDHLLAPADQPAWRDRWGPAACPLLWSHAMFVTLALELGVVEPASRELP